MYTWSRQYSLTFPACKADLFQTTVPNTIDCTADSFRKWWQEGGFVLLQPAKRCGDDDLIELFVKSTITSYPNLVIDTLDLGGSRKKLDPCTSESRLRDSGKDLRIRPGTEQIFYTLRLALPYECRVLGNYHRLCTLRARRTSDFVFAPKSRQMRPRSLPIAEPAFATFRHHYPTEIYRAPSAQRNRKDSCWHPKMMSRSQKS